MWDAFISHASEDKNDFVRPLADSLASYGLNVWYDELSLSVGDSLSRSIDMGLAKSNYGIVVLSHAFLKKDWPEYELRGLTAREIGAKGKVVLPVWYELERSDVLAYSPPLADKLAINASGSSVDDVAIKLIKVIRPDLFARIHRRLRWEEQLRTASVVEVDPRKLKPSPINHEELPLALVGRIRLIRATLWGSHTHSMDVWLDGFRRDLEPEKEVQWWEHVSACYLEFIKSRELTPEQIDDTFAAVFYLCNGRDPDSLVHQKQSLGEADFGLLVKMTRYRYPLLDVEEVFPDELNELPDHVQAQIGVVVIDDIPGKPISEG